MPLAHFILTLNTRQSESINLFNLLIMKYRALKNNITKLPALKIPAHPYVVFI